MYYVTGTITYTTANNRNSANSALQAVLDNYAGIVNGVETAISAGLSTSGSTGLNISVSVPDEYIEQFRLDILGAWSGNARSSVYVGVFKV